jgi:hypothetical protein
LRKLILKNELSKASWQENLAWNKNLTLKTCNFWILKIWLKVVNTTSDLWLLKMRGAFCNTQFLKVTSFIVEGCNCILQFYNIDKRW